MKQKKDNDELEKKVKEELEKVNERMALTERKLFIAENLPAVRAKEVRKKIDEVDKKCTVKVIGVHNRIDEVNEKANRLDPSVDPNLTRAETAASKQRNNSKLLYSWTNGIISVHINRFWDRKTFQKLILQFNRDFWLPKNKEFKLVRFKVVREKINFVKHYLETIKFADVCNYEIVESFD